MNNIIHCIVIAGPTSSGKSKAAVEAAKRFDGEIISADSRQVYKDMNLGTGKVDGTWQKRNGQEVFLYKDVPHYLIDFQEPGKEYNISHFKKDCQNKIIEISEKGKVPIICGGTGFWISSVVYGIELPEVKPNRELRDWLEDMSDEELLKKLEKLDSSRAKKIDPRNRPRLIRAIEIANKLGKVPSNKAGYYQKDGLATGKINGHEVSFSQYAIFPGMEKLEEKIKKRLGKRFKNGMVEEVQNLQKKYGLSLERIQSFGLAYYWIPIYLQNKMKEKELPERIYSSERKYAKRQLTWLKREREWQWIDNSADIKISR
ncbi:MAG: tRNA (adenosine(37)-N6)-dimethylallyltransferase MiaA [Candidatus Moranbacteria bacterium]|nr:tRNA (adenosine(37)-N6)-dimethylallyltransferase MiaA [Candidatus Moranbacteria bacterium]